MMYPEDAITVIRNRPGAGDSNMVPATGGERTILGVGISSEDGGTTSVWCGVSFGPDPVIARIDDVGTQFIRLHQPCVNNVTINRLGTGFGMVQLTYIDRDVSVPISTTFNVEMGIAVLIFAVMFKLGLQLVRK